MAAYSGAPDGVDFSFDRIPGSTLAANHIRLAARYLSHTAGKNLTSAEAQDLRSHGVGVLLNWESSAGRPLLGASAGAVDGHDAAAYAESIGAPHGLTIYYSCDRDVSAGQYDAIAAYYRAAKAATAGGYKVGVYGEFEIVEELHRRGVVDAEWQTYAWSGGRLSVQTDFYQYRNGQRLAGAAVDYDHIIHAADLGAWWPTGNQPAPPIGDDMSAADVAAINKHMDDHLINDPLHGLQHLREMIINSHAQQMAAIAAAGDPAALAAKLAPLLTAAGPVTQAELEAALRTVLGSVDNTP